MCVCMHAGLCVFCVRAYVCGSSVCAFEGVHVAVLLRGALRMHSWYLRDTTQGYSEGTRGVLGGYSCFCRAVLYYL
jgi:hypothetical protein